MKREFSFYEFVGIIVPSVILLFTLQIIIKYKFDVQFVDFGKLGDTTVFLIICYGFGHILQSVGNFFESFVWLIYKGMPTKWLTRKNRFGKKLFEDTLTQRILEKLIEKFGEDVTDYGRLVYNLLFQKQLTARIDIFNGNYSLFRGLAVAFLIVTIACGITYNIKVTLIPTTIFILSLARMIRFAKYYATETYRTFLNMNN